MEIPQTDIAALRKTCKKLIIDLDIPTHGAVTMLYQAISKKRGTTISRQRVSMALTGYRNGDASRIILEDIFSILQGMQEQKQTAAA